VAIEKSRQPQIDTFKGLRCSTGLSERAIVHREMQRRRRLCRDAVVAVIQAADFWNGDNATGCVTGRGLGVSLPSPRCVPERL
jgi:hypothetical protein